MSQETDCKLVAYPSNLIKLRELTKSFHKTIRPYPPQINIKEFDLAEGVSFMVGLFKAPQMAVSRVYSSAGVEFPPHVHDVWELIIVYQGEIHLKIEGDTKILKEKEFYYVKPGEPHGAYYPVDSWVLCITIPASEDFPNG